MTSVQVIIATILLLPLTSKATIETGKASYYGDKWIGRLTANGETYRRGDVTAAHKTLPFNTMVKVTNMNNGKQVVVRINNRGPYVKGRIIDLSVEAAKALEMQKAGVVRVKLETLAKPAKAQKKATMEKGSINQQNSKPATEAIKFRLGSIALREL